MKICFVSQEVAGIRGGGIGTYVAEAGKALSMAGQEVWLITMDPGAELEAKLRDLPGFHRVVIAGQQVAPEDLIWIYHGLPVYKHSMVVHQTLQALGEDFDYIEFADYEAEGYVCFKEQDQFGTYDPAILAVTLHSPTWECFAYDKQVHRSDLRIREVCSLEEEAIRIAPFINSPSEGLRDEVLGRLGYSDREVAIIRYPMELDPELPEPPKPRKSLEQLRFLYYGRIEPRKGIDELVAAFAMMPELEIELIGGDVPYSPFGESYRDYVKHHAPDNVKFLEALPRPKLLKHIRNADVCIFPSLFENYPNTCIEAMAAARVVLGSKHGGMSEMIEHGVSGFHVDGRSPEDIVRVVREELKAALPRLDEIGHAAMLRMRMLSEQKTYVDAILARIADGRAKRKTLLNIRAADRMVSIVIPFYKDHKTIGETVDSAISQTHKNLEILIVNDGSPLPDSAAILAQQQGKDPRIRVLTKKNGGLGSARNFGIDHAKGEYLLFLDADNLARPDYAHIGVEVLERKPESVFIAPNVRFFDDETGETRGIYNALPFNRKTALLINRFGDAGAFFRRSMFVKTGLRYDEVRTAYEDWGLWMDLDRLGLQGECVPRTLYDYRVRSDSMMEEHGRANHQASIGWLLYRHFTDLNPEEAREVLTTIFQIAGKSVLRVMMGGKDQPEPVYLPTLPLDQPAPQPTPVSRSAASRAAPSQFVFDGLASSITIVGGPNQNNQLMSEKQSSICPVELPKLPSTHALLNTDLSLLMSAILTKLDQSEGRLSTRQLHHLSVALESRLDDPENRFSVAYVRTLFNTVYAWRRPTHRADLHGATVAEFGSGNENPFALGLVFLALGAAHFVAIDAAPLLDQSFANRALAQLAVTLAQDSRRVINLPRIPTETVLARLTIGLDKSLGPNGVTLDTPRMRYLAESCTDTSLENQSVDFAYSSGFLEHVPLDATAQELFRISKPGGLQVHNVDFADHGIYDGNANSPITFLCEQPENDYVRTSNRIRVSGMAQNFERAGFEVLLVQRYRTQTPSSEQRGHLVPPFDQLSEDDLQTLGANFVLRRPQESMRNS